jgi:hypothetical protein
MVDYHKILAMRVCLAVLQAVKCQRKEAPDVGAKGGPHVPQ